MKLPTHEDWMNEKFVEMVMKAKDLDRERAVAFLAEKFRCMEDAAKKGVSDKEIAAAGMPLSPEEFFALVFSMHPRSFAREKVDSVDQGRRLA